LFSSKNGISTNILKKTENVKLPYLAKILKSAFLLIKTKKPPDFSDGFRYIGKKY